jgi:hemerythrin
MSLLFKRQSLHFLQSMMTAKNYGDFATHKAAHEAFVEKLGGLSVPISADTVTFAKEW